MMLSASRGAVSAVHLQTVGDDVVVLSFVCRSPEYAVSVHQTIAGRVRLGVYDLSGVDDVAPADRFPAGAPVTLRTYEWDQGETAIDATVLRRVSPTRLEIRTRMGVVRQAHERDLTIRKAAS